MPHRSSARRLAVAVSAVLAVTAGTVLVAVPATAAVPAGANAPAAPGETISIPPVYKVLGAGPSGFLTTSGGSSPVHRWTSTVDGTTTTLPAQPDHLVGHSDTVVARSTTRGAYLLRDMSAPGSPVTVVTEPDAGLRLRAVVGRTLVFSSSDVTTRKGELRLRSEDTGEGPGRMVTGLPADASVRAAESLSSTTALVLYDSSEDGSPTSFRAVVDVPTARVVERRRLGSHDVAADATSFAWVTGKDDGALLRFGARGDEAAGTFTEIGDLTDPGRNFSSLHIGIVGSWVTYGFPGGRTTVHPSPYDPLTAVDTRAPGSTIRLLDHATSTVSAPDGTLLVRGGSVAQGEGVYRIAPDPVTGKPVVTLVASTGEPTALTLLGTEVPAVVDVDSPAGPAKLSWTLSGNDVQAKVTLRHKVTGTTVAYAFNSWVNSPVGGRLALEWDGTGEPLGLGEPGDPVPAGEYTWELNATPLNKIGPELRKTGAFQVVRRTGLHDHTSNTVPDILSRDAAGRLWRDGIRLTGTGSVSPGRYAIGVGWNAYNRLEAVGDVAGGKAPDLVARDASGVLWLYQGDGNGNFATRVKVGPGWNAYERITGGSDLDGDGRPDLLAADTAGVLWFYKATGSATAPFAGRVKVGSGWNAYNELTATGNIGGAVAGDLVARDKDGILWLYLGKGDGTFAQRIRIGGGWNAYGTTVGIGDVDLDGRADLMAVTAEHGVPYFYSGTGDWRAPFAPRSEAHGDAYPGGTVF
ncbi:FG-GAP repeat domain-containing protein [Streptomyces cinereoruber]|uniref:FG-GAP repeat domain-containing protein n=1 Tax=Streptomyces cinereoruber TaxID=67260 RepID=UPI0036425039